METDFGAHGLLGGTGPEASSCYHTFIVNDGIAF
jgi:hypothetical protein